MVLECNYSGEITYISFESEEMCFYDICYYEGWGNTDMWEDSVIHVILCGDRSSISTLTLVFRFLRGDLGDFILIPFHLASGCPFDGLIGGDGRPFYLESKKFI